MQPTLSGSSIVHHPDVESSFLRQKRQVDVYLPEAYRSGGTGYPCLYMQDGQALFEPFMFEGQPRFWNLKLTLDSLNRLRRTKPFIVVGIHCSSDRNSEYSPVTDSVAGGGGGMAYLRFLVEELKPLIDGCYRTDPRRESTGIGGASQGGLMALEACCRYEQIFSRAAVLSPSLFWGDYHIHALARERFPKDTRLWIDMGDEETVYRGGARQAVADLTCFRSILEGRGMKEEQDFKSYTAWGADHSENSWGKRIGVALEFLFAGAADAVGGT